MLGAARGAARCRAPANEPSGTASRARARRPRAARAGVARADHDRHARAGAEAHRQAEARARPEAPIDLQTGSVGGGWHGGGV